MTPFKPIYDSFKLRVGGGVLQLTLGIGIVISIVCSSMILLAYFSKFVWLKNDIEKDVRNNAVSGVQYAMAIRSNLAFFQPQIVDLFLDETDSVEVTRRPWGVFEACIAVARRGKNSHTKAVLITGQPSERGKSVIYTPENNSPLYLVGKTSIVGTAYLSERKLSNGYIDGKDYSGKTLITGDIKKSDHTMPLLDTILLDELKSVYTIKPNLYNLQHLDFKPANHSYSFQPHQTNYYFSEQSIDVTDSLAGNLIVHSAIKVRLTADAKVSDIIIMAPQIEIDGGFEGTVQCYATRSITVGAESKLNYPSALILAGTDTDSTIVIRRNARVTGLVIIPGYDRNTGSRGLLKIEEKAVLHGMAYINGSSDIRGSLWGHITTRQFVTNVGSSEYVNHIMNAEINSTKRSAYMPGTLLWENTKELCVAKWLE